MCRRAFVLAILAAFVPGCGSSLPPQTDETKGRELLTSVLDAWKSGTKFNEVTSKVPGVLVRDPDWKAGSQLTQYELAATSDRSGVDLLISVKLSLTKPDGQSREAKVNYAIGTGSQTIVFRHE